ncbi:hypothetical protein SFRURICE_016605, partial [Spodoptera frugiperda]
MEGQINVLKDLQSVITKALTNYKKSPKDRLTVEYIETRLELLENDWSSFKDTKCSLYKNYKLEDISQKVADIYDTTEDTYITYKCAMNNELPTLEQFKKFIESRFRALEFIEPKKVHQGSNIAHAHSPKAMLATETSSMLCEKYLIVKMEGQINVLKDLQSVITKALTNYKKSPKDRLTVEYIETRLELLENDWSSFKDTKCSLYKNYKLEDISQKVADIYDTTEDTYITYKCAMNNELPTLEQFKKFIEGRFRALEFIEPKKVHQGSNIAHAHSPKAMLATKTSSMLCDQIVACLSTGKIAKPSQVLLATALIKAESKTGQFMTVRALLDQGSQACFITEATVQLLRLKKSLVRGVITCLGNNSSTTAKYMVTLTIKSKTDDSFQLKINAY